MPGRMAGEHEQGGQRAAGRDLLDPFLLIRPERPGAMVFTSPHSGEVYPEDMRPASALSPASLRSAADARVDRLIAPATRYGVTLLAGRYGRAYLDLNRGPEELDPQIILGAPSAAASARAAAGYGVVPRLSGDGRPLYDRRLDLSEVEGRLRHVHAPYHATLDALMFEAHARCGRAVVVDWHSMPSRAVGGARGPDIVLGDRHGSACEADLTRRARTAFEKLGWRVALNHPYAGGWTTARWGRPSEGFHALQVELSRALYLDEINGTLGRGWDRCAAGVAQVIKALAEA